MGKQMVKLPLHPRLAHMVVRGHSALAADLAAMLSERDGLPRALGVDVTSRLAAIRGGARDRIRQTAKQIRQIAGIKDDESDLSPGLLVAFAFPDRIAQRRGGDRRYRLSGGGGAVLPEHDALVTQDFLAVATTDGAAGDQKIFLAAPLSLKEIEEHFRDQIEARDGVFWDGRTKAVSASKSRRLGALVLEEKPSTNADPTLIAEAMTEGVREMGLAALPWTEGAKILRARVMFLRRLFPEEGWPDLSDEALLASLEDWLGPDLAGCTRRAHLARVDVHGALMRRVDWRLRRRLDEEAPTHVQVPTGSRIPVDYADPAEPALEVRLQEMFGAPMGPRICGGRVALTLRLLSPAGRPIQVTRDLAGFWAGSYADVRREMRGRYPRHPWPDDPLAAAPTRRAKPRGT